MISITINAIISFLSLSEKNIIKIKNKGIGKEQLIKCLNIKFILFYSISFIFLIFFWYYLGCFCAVYINTQIHLITDTLLSFGLSLLYPFCICLLPGIFRIISLKDSGKGKKFLYIFSKLLQLIFEYSNIIRDNN